MHIHCPHGVSSNDYQYPNYLQSLFKQQPGTVGTHGQLKLSLKVHNTELYRKSSQHSGARSWNLLPDHIKTTQDCHKFSKLSKEFYYSVHVVFFSLLFCFTLVVFSYSFIVLLCVLSVYSGPPGRSTKYAEGATL